MFEHCPVIELKFGAPDAPDAGEIVGIASAFGNPDAMGDIVAPGAFAVSLSEHKAAGTMPAMLWAHTPARSRLAAGYP